MRLKISAYLAISYLLLMLSCANAYALTLKTTDQSIAIGNDLHFLYDNDQFFTADEALEQLYTRPQLENESIALDYSGKTLWLATELNSEANDTINFVLELQNSKSPAVSFYLFSGQQIVKQFEYPNDIQDYRFKRPIFAFDLQPLEQVTLLVKIRHVNSGIRPIIWQQSAFNDHTMLTVPILGAFLGILIGLAIYNLILYFGLKHAAFLWYSAYIFATLAWRILFSDHGAAFIPANWNILLQPYSASLALCALIFAGCFCYFFLELKKIKSHFEPWVKRLIIAIICASVISLFVSARFTLLMIGILTLIAGPLFLSAAISAWNKGQVTARYYILSWLPLILAALYTQLSIWQLVPSLEQRTLLLDIAILFEAFLLTLALADKLKMSENEKNYIASHDPITGLPNHNTLVAQLVEHHEKKEFTLLQLNIQRIHIIQNTLGLKTANEILTVIAARLTAWSKNQKQLLNLGVQTHQPIYLGQLERGQLILAVADTLNEPDNIIKAIRMEVQRPIEYHAITLDCDCHVGVAYSKYHCDNIEQLIQNVNIASNIAVNKQLPFILYSDEKNLFTERRLALMTDLKKAIQSKSELFIHVQPQITLQDGKPYGGEALIRWHHQEHGFIAPTEFIPIAEEAGLISAISLWVIEEALQINQVFNQKCKGHVISVNISAHDLEHPQFVNNLAALLKRSPLPNNQLLLEVTESAMMSEPGLASLALARISQLGVLTSIDDFGTGYSSLSYLSLLPVNELKIDKSFILDIGEKEQNYTITEIILSLSKNLSLTSVAEGIEDQLALDTLKQLQCDIGQGYYISKPLAVTQYLTWLDDHKSITTTNKIND
ncbi:EAL domain-containing protein [Algibacillus agarilyticus]|uniref:EAL domain-containing protein n=1 Tax=Algibacillus agarilyticus TaxID=2234133 RepID=UPI000DD0D9A0|nr:EAL domain-containing protein [Algibacillus agarilyticus]